MRRKIISVVLLISIFLPVCLFNGCSADKTEGVASLCFNFSGGSKKSCDTVCVYRKDEDEFLFFLPSEVSLNDAVLFFNSSEKIYANDMELKSGKVNEIFSEPGEYTLKSGENEYSLRIVQSANIPAVFITTESGSLDSVHSDKEYKEKGEICIIEDGKVSDIMELSYIKGRGNMTWSGDKRPYNIKLSEKTSLFGMQPSKKWCLLANALDDTLLRNSVALSLAGKMGLAYTVEYQPVDLYINGEYRGSYLLTEKIEVGDGRVEITDLDKLNEEVNGNKNLDTLENVISGGNLDCGSLRYTALPREPDDVTGGYLLEIDGETYYDEETNGFITDGGQFVTVKSPEIAGKSETEYIQKFCSEAEEALISEDGINSLGRHYSEYIDVEALAKMYVLQEFLMNSDSAFTSCYFYKEAGESTKLVACCPWDFDQCMSFDRDTMLEGLFEPQNRCVNILCVNQYNYLQSIYTIAYKHTDFRKTVSVQWNKYRDILTGSFVGTLINEEAERIKYSASADSFRWDNFNIVSFDEKAELCKTKAVEALSDFIEKRTPYADKAFSADAVMLFYDMNGGEGYMFSETIAVKGDSVRVKSEGENAFLTVTAPSGMKFVSWNTASDGTGETYYPDEKIVLNKPNTVLYAQWEKE